jgi:hypothetical protein
MAPCKALHGANGWWRLSDLRLTLDLTAGIPRTLEVCHSINDVFSHAQKIGASFTWTGAVGSGEVKSGIADERGERKRKDGAFSRTSVRDGGRRRTRINCRTTT